jgi:hypothetical protein
MRRTLLAAAGLALLCGAAPPIRFMPQRPQFAASAAEYAEIWRADGPRIVQALEAATELHFPENAIDALVVQGRPMMSYDGRSMRLRADYSPDYKRATLVHELGHRLAFLLPRPDGMDDHRLLYLFLYDAWTDLYGSAFADRMVAIERRIPGGYDYDAAWTWALSQSREQRQERLRRLREDAPPSAAAAAFAAPEALVPSVRLERTTY